MCFPKPSFVEQLNTLLKKICLSSGQMGLKEVSRIDVFGFLFPRQRRMHGGNITAEESWINVINGQLFVDSLNRFAYYDASFTPTH